MIKLPILFLLPMLLAAETKPKRAKECIQDSDTTISTFGGLQYKCVGGRLILDEEAMKQQNKRESDRLNLLWALRTRVLTNEEMSDVERLGIYLLVGLGMQFQEVEQQKLLDEYLLQQLRIRAMSGCSGEKEKQPK